MARDLAKLGEECRGTGTGVVYHFLLCLRSHTVPLHMRVTGADISSQFWVPGNPCQLPAIENEPYNKFQPLQSLKHFLQRGREMDPAKHYAFFFNGHGCCVYLKINDDSDDDIILRRPLPTTITTHVDQDKSNKMDKMDKMDKTRVTAVTDILTTHNIGIAALAQMLQRESFHFAILAFDACLMATLETAYECRNICSYMIASEQYEGWQGLNSPMLVAQFREHQTRSIRQIALNIASDYIARANQNAHLHASDTISDMRDVTVIHSRSVFALIRSIHKLVPSDSLHEPTNRQNPCTDTTQLSCAWIDPVPSDETAYVDLYSFLHAQQSLVSSKYPRDDWMLFEAAFDQVVILYQQNDGFKTAQCVYEEDDQDQTNCFPIRHHNFHGLSCCINAHRDSAKAAALYSDLRLPHFFCRW